MSQDNQFHQYGYNHYLKAPTQPSPRAHMHSRARFPSGLLQKIQEPRIAAFSLLAAGALFVGIIVATYPSGDDAQRQIPIVKADLRPIKTAPEVRGGMNIPHRDSTILARVGQSSVKDKTQNIENLLSRSNENLVSKEEAIERAMSDNPEVPTDVVAQMQRNTVPTLLREEHETMAAVDTHENAVDNVQMVVADAKPDFEIKEPSADGILQKIGTTEGDNDVVTSEFAQKVAVAAAAVKPNRVQMHAAATSPETLDFVRGILNEKGSQSMSGKALSSIEPAAGAASPAVNITAGAYFVQLASITDAARAGVEWQKMQAHYDVLSSSKFRVQEASLPRGTFYRIQAGPMSKASANEICAALKAADKPGGCLVVK